MDANNIDGRAALIDVAMFERFCTFIGATGATANGILLLVWRLGRGQPDAVSQGVCFLGQ